MKVTNDIELVTADCSKFDDLYTEIVIHNRYTVALTKEPKQKFVSIHLWDTEASDFGEGVNLSDFRKALDLAEHSLMSRSEYQEPEI